MGKKKVNKYQISIKPKQEERIEENFRLLKLDGMLASYKRLTKDFFTNGWTPFDLIEKLQQAETNWDEGNRVDRWIQNAKFEINKTFNELIDKVSDNPLHLRRLMNLLARPRILILDEIALFEPNDNLAKFLVELLLNRHLKTSTIFTSNKTFKSWGNAFGDTHTSAMVLDRITQHIEIIDIDGPSYRLKDRLSKESLLLSKTA